MVRGRAAAQTRHTDEEGPTAQANDLPAPTPRRWPMAVALVAVVLAVVIALGGGLSLLLGGSTPSSSDSDGFPTEVLGMPVLTVDDAIALIGRDAIDGRAIAVRGWWLTSM